jgi:hypothetical protein
MRLPLIGLFIATFAASCGAGAQHSATAGSLARTSPTTTAGGRETFSAEQLSSTAAATVFEALTTLKPEVLTGRGRGAPDVYVGTVKQQTGLDRLKELSVSAVQEVTYLRYDQARTLTDAQSPGGAIVVTLR